MSASNVEVVRAELTAHIEAAQREGVSLAAYARSHGLSVERLYRIGHRLRNLAQKNKSPKVSQAKAAAQPATPFAQVRVPLVRPARVLAQLPNGVTLEFDYGAGDISLASALINTLARCDVPV